jgi:bifunctional aspartokinase / homoserine dehydrogenase 1
MSDERTLVMKFGGTSVGSPEAFEQTLEIIQQAQMEWKRLVVVISAMSGVTDLLLKSAENAANGDGEFYQGAFKEILKRHDSVIQTFIQDQLEQEQVHKEIAEIIEVFINLCQAIQVLGETTPRALDAVASSGERMSVRLLSAILNTRGIEAAYVEASQLIITDDHFQYAHPDLELTTEHTQKVLDHLLKNNVIPIVTGFMGANRSGAITTLGRGGSDYSAALIAAVLPADEVWIWTDVDGVMSADPRLVPMASTIQELSYREVAELAYFGAKVLQPRTIRPIIEAGISLRVCNTFNPSHPGTQIIADFDQEKEGKVKAVTIIRNQQLITLEGRGMLGVPGVAARTFGAVAATGTSVPLITQASSEQSICFAVPTTATQSVIDSLNDEFQGELFRRDIDRVWATEEVAIITIVGAGMRNTPGIAGRIFSILGENDVNVIAIAQGSSEVSVSLVVDAKDAETALTGLHSLIY